MTVPPSNRLADSGTNVDGRSQHGDNPRVMKVYEYYISVMDDTNHSTHANP